MASGPLPFLGQTDSPLLRRSVLDDVTGNPLITSAPTGEVRQRVSLLPLGINDSGRVTLAVPQMAFDAIDYARAPARVLSGDLQVWDPATGHTSDAAREAATGLAGVAMTGSMPFKAPKGALRSFGGVAAAKDDSMSVLAALEAELADYVPKPLPEIPASSGVLGASKDFVEPPPRVPYRVDPNASSWDLYHGSEPGVNFQRFDPNMASIPSERGAVFFAPNPADANGYTGMPRLGAEAGSRVFRTTIDPGKTAVFDIPHLAETDAAFNARARQNTIDEAGKNWGPLWDNYMETFRNNRASMREINQQVEAMGYQPTALDGISYGHGHIGAAVQMAKDQGLDTAILRGLVEHGGDDQVIALTPGRVRSYYDPSQLLYSGGPAGALTGLPAMAASDGDQPASLPFLGRR